MGSRALRTCDNAEAPLAGPSSPPAATVGLSVWATAQQTGPTQRRGRYLPDSTRHPARMLPAIATHAIHAYTRPGELVFDPSRAPQVTVGQPRLLPMSTERRNAAIAALAELFADRLDRPPPAATRRPRHSPDEPATDPSS
jgi:hypothetical protein